ncbi:MAG: hypothetical protein QM770_20725 [Tepidisphaeraceae bacterium]
MAQGNPFQPNTNATDDRRDATTNPNAPEHDNTTGQVVGASVGGTTGGLTGAAIGTAIGGPIGAAIGAVAGVVVGALSGKVIADANADDDGYWRENYHTRDYYKSGDSFDTYAGAYRYGASAADKNAGRSFADMENDIRADYEKTPEAANLSYDRARGAIRDAYERRRDFADRQKLNADRGSTRVPDIGRDADIGRSETSNLSNLRTQPGAEGTSMTTGRGAEASSAPVPPPLPTGSVAPFNPDTTPTATSAGGAMTNPVNDSRELRDPLLENRDALVDDGDESDDITTAEQQLESRDVLDEDDVIDELDEDDRQRVLRDPMARRRDNANRSDDDV